MPTSRKNWLIIAAVVGVAAAVGLSAMTYAFAYGSWPTGNLQGAYTGGPTHMGGMMGGWSYLNTSQLDSITASQPATAANGTLTFTGDSVKILVLMGPMAEGQSMYSFVVDNYTNPTLVFPQGARVTLVVVNVDTDAYHGLTLTGVAPPYSYNFMPMMMYSFTSTGVLPPSSSGFASQQISFTVNGGMYYVCPVPGHAQSGMYGQIRAG